MGKGITKTVKPSRATYEVLEEMVSTKGSGIHSGHTGGGNRVISGKEEI